MSELVPPDFEAKIKELAEKGAVEIEAQGKTIQVSMATLPNDIFNPSEKQALYLAKQEAAAQQHLAAAKANAEKVIAQLEKAYDTTKLDLKVLAAILKEKSGPAVINALVALHVDPSLCAMYVDAWMLMNEGPGSNILSKLISKLGKIGGAVAGGTAAPSSSPELPFGGGLIKDSDVEAWFKKKEQEAIQKDVAKKQAIYNKMQALGNAPQYLVTSAQVKEQYEALMNEAAPNKLPPPGWVPNLMFKGYEVKLDPSVPMGKIVFLNPDPTMSLSSVTLEDASKIDKDSLLMQMAEIVNQGFTDIHASKKGMEAYGATLNPATMFTSLPFKGELHFGSGKKGGKDNWGTPVTVIDWLETNVLYGKFDLDAFASDENAKAELYFTPEQDGYTCDWFGKVFINPEYSNIAKALTKAAFEHQTGHTEVIVALVAARTDTQWWWDAVHSCQQVIFLKGRIKFLDPDGVVMDPAPFPSAFLIWDQGLQHNGGPYVNWVDMKKDNPLIAATSKSLEAADTLLAPDPHTPDSPDADPQ